MQPLVARASEKYTLLALCGARTKVSARWLHCCGGQTSLMVLVTRFAPLSSLPVLLGRDPDVRSVWIPLFEDIPLHIPFLPSLPSRRDLVTASREWWLWRCSEPHWGASLRHCNRYLSARQYARCAAYTARFLRAGCNSVVGRPVLWCLSLTLHSLTSPYYPPEETWSAIRESVGCCGGVASLAGERVCAFATVDCARV